MTETGIDLWGAVFQAASFLCLMAIPWVDGKIRWILTLVAGAGILSILGFQLYIGVEKQDYELAKDLMLVTITNAILFFAVSLGVERVLRLYLISRKKDRRPPPPS
jgi:signal transduction histidine kinase